MNYVLTRNMVLRKSVEIASRAQRKENSMYEDGDYYDFYYEILGRFPGLDRKFGLQHSDLRDALCVHIDEEAGASESDAKAFLEWASNDASFVFASVKKSEGVRVWEFIFTDLRDAGKLRRFMTYFLPVGQDMPDECEDLSHKMFITGGIRFSRDEKTESNNLNKLVHSQKLDYVAGC